MPKLKIIVITGSRADYSHLRPLLKKLWKNKNFHCLLYAADSHFLKELGYSAKEIKQDGFKINRAIRVSGSLQKNPYEMALWSGEAIKKFAHSFKKDKPALVLIMGDRIETLSAALAASLMNIPVAHIGGGDVAFADIDNTLRHAITKLSHLHFTHSQKSSRTVLQLGEEKWRIFQTGIVSLDAILKTKHPSKKNLLRGLKIPALDYLLVVFHPVTTTWQKAAQETKIVLASSVKIANREKINVLVVYPNFYAGSDKIIKVIKKHQRENKCLYALRNIAPDKFASLLKYARVLIGNSSCGIVEAPSLHLAVVDIGERQLFREKAANVIHIPSERKKIEKSIEKALFNKKFQLKVKQCQSPYGNGTASQKIIRVLSRIKTKPGLRKLLKKKFTNLPIKL